MNKIMHSVTLEKLALLENFISNFIPRKSYLNQSPEKFFSSEHNINNFY